jgi:acetyl-CoA acyltransferase
MGHTAERVAERYGVAREAQDAFALRSHQRALAAQAEGAFDAEIVPVPLPDGGVVSRDDGPRAESSAAGLAKLRPAFNARGSVTAGNSSQTSDGAAAVLVMEAEHARRQGLAPMARMLSYAVVGVPPDVMGIGPMLAVPEALERAGLALADVDLFELNEAFASQAVACARELGIPDSKLNVLGGAIALGHPLGATGARLLTTLLHALHRREERYGVVTMCVGGGMGAAGVFERLPGWKPPA